MKFSICIPNYNYEQYIERTIRSVLEQSHDDLEVLISDNASTDRSVEIIKGIHDPRILTRVNACNVGFAGNLDKAASMATGDWMIMLSSDDLVRPGALSAYKDFAEGLGSERDTAVISSAVDVIDSQDVVTGKIGPEMQVWRETDRVPALETVLDAPVYRVPAPELLRRCLQTMKNPFNFASTAYRRDLYQKVEGYGGGRLINPDKWFHWRLLAVAETAYFIDRPLFAYRWHPQNQTAQQASTGALKYLVDEYSSTLELDEVLLARAGMTREQVARAFVEYDIARHGLATLARGQRQRAQRILDFGRAAYPQLTKRNRKAIALAALLTLHPLGQSIAKRAYGFEQSTRGKGTTI
ncbi:MAG: glycosyltransferase [Acidobacteria bacterium]|nr:glycosyltransferase [Acidobacteriota bacterium]